MIVSGVMWMLDIFSRLTSSLFAVSSLVFYSIFLDYRYYTIHQMHFANNIALIFAFLDVLLIHLTLRENLSLENVPKTVPRWVYVLILLYISISYTHSGLEKIFFFWFQLGEWRKLTFMGCDFRKLSFAFQSFI